MDRLLGSSMVGLMATSSKRDYATSCMTQVAAPRALSSWQATADPCLSRRHSNTGLVQETLKHRSSSVSGVSGSWFKTQGFVWALRVSLARMGCDSKHDFAPPTILPRLLLCPWVCSIFSWWDPTSPVNGCSAASCNFGVLAREDECMSFFSTCIFYDIGINKLISH